MKTLLSFLKNLFVALPIVGVGVVSMLFIIERTPSAQSAVLPYYGGMRTAVIPCACSGNSAIILLDYSTNAPLTLVYQEGVSKLFLNQNIYGTYLLGSYTPGGGSCWMAGSPCWMYPTDGIMDSAPGAGTSL